MNKVNVLRKKYPRFIYEKYYYKIFKNDLKILFDFKIDSNYEKCSRSICFKPEITIKNIDKKQLSLIGDKILDNFVFHLGLMEIPSYWKASCSPEIEIRAGYLNKNQIKWWKDFILNGMGQFFYENQINFKSLNFLKITSVEKDSSPPKMAENCSMPFLTKKFLIPMGEGKDSIVTLELLKQKFDMKNLNCFIVNPTKEHFKILKIAKIKNPIIVKRKVDLVLSKLNQKGFLNGHTPITAVISNLAVFCGVLFGYKNIALSCEKSANEGNVRYLEKIINHQWSKTFEFEKKFRNYIKKYLAKNIQYFSFLRTLYEIQIAKIFSQFPQYFPVFLSCNEARKTKSWTKKPTGKWCGKCSKCLFIWTILYPFVEEKKLIKIFHKNLFEDKKLLPIMKQLIGESKTKPFECIGAKKECLIAFYLSWRKYREQFSVKLPFLLKYFENNILPKHPNLKNKSALLIRNS